MPKFKIYASQLVHHVIEVEAKDIDEAENIAWEDDLEWEFSHCGDWEIDDIEEVK